MLFRFYNEIDLRRVIDGMPWFFNIHIIVFHKLEKGEDPIQVQIIFANFWVQVHELLLSCMSEGMARQLGNIIGEFLDYDTVIISKGIKKFMRIKVKLDVRNPLRRRKRIVYGVIKQLLFTFNTINCLFYFLCGRLEHRESFCFLRLARGIQEDDYR